MLMLGDFIFHLVLAHTHTHTLDIYYMGIFFEKTGLDDAND